MTELKALLAHSDAWPVAPGMFVSTLDDLDGEQSDTHFAIGECNRNTPLQACGVIFRSFKILRRHRPDVVLTTGSMPLALFALVAKLFGTKVIWIDSISQVDEISASGRLIRSFADLFTTRSSTKLWPGFKLFN